MALNQPIATIIAAGIMASGAVIVALINKKASDKPMTPKAIDAPVVTTYRGIWPSVIILAFSVFMLVRSFIDLAPFWKSKVPASEDVVISIFIYGAAAFVFLVITSWSAAAIWFKFRR